MDSLLKGFSNLTTCVIAQKQCRISKLISRIFDVSEDCLPVNIFMFHLHCFENPDYNGYNYCTQETEQTLREISENLDEQNVDFEEFCQELLTRTNNLPYWNKIFVRALAILRFLFRKLADNELVKSIISLYHAVIQHFRQVAADIRNSLTDFRRTLAAEISNFTSFSGIIRFILDIFSSRSIQENTAYLFNYISELERNHPRRAEIIHRAFDNFTSVFSGIPLNMRRMIARNYFPNYLSGIFGLNSPPSEEGDYDPSQQE